MTAKGCVHFFFAPRQTSKVPGLSNLRPRQIKTLGVVGGGLMGSGIAAAALMSGIKVVLKDMNDKLVNDGVSKITGIFKKRLNEKRLSQEQYNAIVGNLSGQVDYKGFDKLDMVIEAIIERLDIKQKLFSDLEKYCNPNCILATNTSTLDIVAIGEKTRALKRIIGLHFFSPAHVMPLLEIIRHDQLDQQVLIDSLAFSKKIRKTPVVVGNCAGFAVNRIFFPYGESSHFLALRGIKPERIDAVIKKFGMPMGPFTMYDFAGIDVLYHATNTMGKAYADRASPMRLLELQFKSNQLGQKTKIGTYKYEGRNPQPNPDFEKFVQQTRKELGIYESLDLSDEEIVEVILYPVVNEACRVVEEKIVYRVSDIDVATVMGMGFPAYYGGVMKWGDLIGPRTVYEKLNQWYQRTGEKMFKPCKFLEDCARSGTSFYDKKL